MLLQQTKPRVGGRGVNMEELRAIRSAKVYESVITLAANVIVCYRWVKAQQALATLAVAVGSEGGPSSLTDIPSVYLCGHHLNHTQLRRRLPAPLRHFRQCETPQQ